MFTFLDSLHIPDVGEPLVFGSRRWRRSDGAGSEAGLPSLRSAWGMRMQREERVKGATFPPLALEHTSLFLSLSLL